MGEHTQIEWARHTFNPWWGCTKVSPACDNCYAEALARRYGREAWGAKAPRIMLSEDNWRKPLRWNRRAAEAGRRERVFCGSMCDVFEWNTRVFDAQRRLWNLIGRTPRLDWLLLTKRPHLVSRIMPGSFWRSHGGHNVWLGATVENQRFAEERIPHLLDYPFPRVRFLSCEPLLGPVDLRPWIGSLDWVIAGGESGGGARPTHPDWIRSLRDQCVANNVPFFLKQWGNLLPVEDGDSVAWKRMAKKAAGRVLDGRAWDELPWQK